MSRDARISDSDSRTRLFSAVRVLRDSWRARREWRRAGRP